MIKKRPGKLIVFSGCMFSGKTNALIKEILKLNNSKKKVIVFKSYISNRHKNKDILKSRNGKFIDAINLIKWEDILPILKKESEIDVIAIDEIHFFTYSFVYEIDKILDTGIDVYVAGLDRGFSDNILPIMNYLFAFADKIYKFTAWCSKCGKQANKTQRINYKKNEILPILNLEIDFVGGKELYEPRCRKCFVRFK